MSSDRDERGTDHSAAGPVANDGGALRAGASSAPPSSAPPAGDGSENSPAASASGGEAGGAQVEKDLDALLADTRQERAEYLDLAKRTKADFENYRKRMAAEVAAANARGKAALVGELIHVIDNLERALEAAGIDSADEAPAPAEALAQGILLTYRELCTALQRAGVEPLDTAGEKFDPNLHEALSTRAADGAEAGTVVDVMQKGYRLGEQLIRPARVVVAE
jgi:molecular chaperone GrpE